MSTQHLGPPKLKPEFTHMSVRAIAKLFGYSLREESRFRSSTAVCTMESVGVMADFTNEVGATQQIEVIGRGWISRTPTDGPFLICRGIGRAVKTMPTCPECAVILDMTLAHDDAVKTILDESPWAPLPRPT